MSDTTDTRNAEEPIILRTEDGAWYAVPAAELERAHIADAARLAEVRGHMATTGEGAPAALVAGEALETYRLDDEQAAALEAAAAADTTGFRIDGWFWNHNEGIGFVAVDGVLRPAYRVPLDLVAQRGLIVRGPGYGR